MPSPAPAPGAVQLRCLHTAAGQPGSQAAMTSLPPTGSHDPYLGPHLSIHPHAVGNTVGERGHYADPGIQYSSLIDPSSGLPLSQHDPREPWLHDANAGFQQYLPQSQNSAWSNTNTPVTYHQSSSIAQPYASNASPVFHQPIYNNNGLPKPSSTPSQGSMPQYSQFQHVQPVHSNPYEQAVYEQRASSSQPVAAVGYQLPFSDTTKSSTDLNANRDSFTRPNEGNLALPQGQPIQNTNVSTQPSQPSQPSHPEQPSSTVKTAVDLPSSLKSRPSETNPSFQIVDIQTVNEVLPSRHLANFLTISCQPIPLSLTRR